MFQRFFANIQNLLPLYNIFLSQQNILRHRTNRDWTRTPTELLLMHTYNFALLKQISSSFTVLHLYMPSHLPKTLLKVPASRSISFRLEYTYPEQANWLIMGICHWLRAVTTSHSLCFIDSAVWILFLHPFLAINWFFKLKYIYIYISK